MSLVIYVRGEHNSIVKPIIRDVELQFLKTRLYKNDYILKALKEIEKAEYNDEHSFIDRFGFKLYSKDLSTGCKAAICVHAFPNMIIDVVECGLNALNFIISNCKDGAILISEGTMQLFYKKGAVDVILDGKRFTDCDDLVDYISER